MLPWTQAKLQSLHPEVVKRKLSALPDCKGDIRMTGQFFGYGYGPRGVLQHFVLSPREVQLQSFCGAGSQR